MHSSTRSMRSEAKARGKAEEARQGEAYAQRASEIAPLARERASAAREAATRADAAANSARELKGQSGFKFKNGTYYGQSNGSVPDGLGVFISKDKRYEGEWNNGKRHGYGKENAIDNSVVYRGEWKNDMMDGVGVSILQPSRYPDEDQQTHEGEYKNGLQEGYGKYFHINGDVYEGEFKNDDIEGFGILNYNRRGIYKGTLKNNKKNGYGKYESFDGSKSYVGSFKNDQPYIGYGMFHVYGRFPGTYKGESMNSKADGNGRMEYYGNGDVYEGQFKNNQRHGHGKLTLENGDVHEGIWFNDKMENRITFPTGEHFVNGVPLRIQDEAALSSYETDHSDESYSDDEAW